MIFKRFTLRVVSLVVLIAGTGLLMVWSFDRPNLAVARFAFTVIWIILIVSLIVYVNRTNRTLRSFLESLRYLDSVRENKGKGRSFEELDRLYNEIVGVIRKVETERETERQYFRLLVDHAGVGIISFNELGEVEIVNDAAKKLLKMRQLKNISALAALSGSLPELLSGEKPGSHKLLKLLIDNEVVGLTIRIAEYRIGGRKIKIASLQNIRNELEEEELDAWQKLIRVLTHEIMNSITPVNSLTNTIIRLFERGGQPRQVHDLEETDLANALEALHSIEKRNKGLIGFVQSYRSLTQMQKPRFTRVEIEKLLSNINRLIAVDMENAGINFACTISPEGIVIDADEKLIEQVLLNLINNSRHALFKVEEPVIRVHATVDGDYAVIGVHDNGCGIPEEILSNIFIPFFTTREEGSGIGLSLSRQIMRLHGGSISVKSQPETETVFSLRFPM
jgi:signal transduction histidine kinase